MDDGEHQGDELAKKRKGRKPKAAAGEAPAKPKRARKGKQTQIPGTERNERNPAIESAAADYVEVRDERMALTKKEVAAREVLRAAMKQAGITIYECDGEDFTVELIPAQEEKVKVTRREADEDDDAGEGGF
jgi:hypothetical protein